MTASTPVVRRPAVERLCFCGRVFKAKPSDIENGGGKYCSTRCANSTPRYAGRGARSVRIERECEQCQAKISITEAAVRHGKGRYCSLSCANRARGMASRKLVDCVCKCGQSFQVKPSRITAGEGKYCSNSCASKFKTREKAAPKQVTCPCGVTFTRPNVRSTQSFCSDICRLEKLKGGGNLSRPVHIGRDRSASSVFTDLGHSGFVRCARCSRERERGARCACERQEMAS